MDNVRDLAKRESIYVKILRTYISYSRIRKEASVAVAERTRKRVEGERGGEGCWGDWEEYQKPTFEYV